MKTIIKRIRPYFFEALGLVLLVFAILDWANIWQLLGELIGGLLALFVGLGLKAANRDNTADRQTEDERDQYITQKTDYLTLKFVDYALIVTMLGLGIWYVLSGRTAVAGILTIGTLLIWLLITVINIITGFVVDYQN
jgi:uncharacterized membrane protein